MAFEIRIACTLAASSAPTTSPAKTLALCKQFDCLILMTARSQQAGVDLPGSIALSAALKPGEGKYLCVNAFVDAGDLRGSLLRRPS